MKKYTNKTADSELSQAAKHFLKESILPKYSYNFTWMGRPVIQYPQDLIAMQEIIWRVKPDLIIETGIAHGGSIIFYASLLELIGKGEVIGIDIDIRKENRKAIETHPMFNRITMIENSSVSTAALNKVADRVKGKKSVMVTLDSNHTHDHVLKELECYSPFVTMNSYLVVFDTIIEDLPNNYYPDRPWCKGNNPKTAVFEFLKNSSSFEIDTIIQEKLLITAAPDGYLKRVEV